MIDVVKFLVEKGSKINVNLTTSRYPLILAIENKLFDVVKFFIEKGANIQQ